MNVQQQKQEKGFTIIEVILVLAIAGLIFLMVFLALPALQRGQRDTDRKNDASALASAYTNWVSNNRNTTTTPSGSTIADYAQNLSGNTDKTKVRVRSGAGTITVADGAAVISTGTKCGTSSANGSQQLSAGSRRQITVTVRLEASNNTAYCLDS